MTINYGDDLQKAELQAGGIMSPRAQLVSAFFDHMNQQDLPWVVMNNYDGLPAIIPSDIDFSIPPTLFFRLDEFICDFAEKSDALLVQKLWHGNMKCAYILATGPKGSREFVQLDFFAAFSTKGAPALISHEDLVAGRRALRNFHVPRPEIELIFTALRRLFKDDWSDRHCSRVAELNEYITDTDWLPKDYVWIRPTLESAIRGDVEAVNKRRNSDWAQLRKTAHKNLTLREKIANATLQARRLVVRLRDETGQLIILAACRERLSDQALDTLEMVFHRRVFVNVKGGIGMLAKLALLKRRKGLIFVLAGADHPNGKAMAQRIASMGLADQVLHTGDDLSVDLAALKIPATRFSSDSEAIEVIMNIQVAKTIGALARGCTQTSGTAN